MFKFNANKSSNSFFLKIKTPSELLFFLFWISTLRPNLDETDKKVLIKNLNKQLETLSVNSILQDQSKNKVNDQDVNGVKVRFQNVEDLPPKELRKLVDKGKKDLGEGIVLLYFQLLVLC